MRRIEALLALAAITNAQGVPRPTRLRIYEVRTALRFDEGELQRVNFRYDRSSGIKADIARSLVDVGLTTDRGFVFEVAFFGTEDPAFSFRPLQQRGDSPAPVFMLRPPLLQERSSPPRPP